MLGKTQTDTNAHLLKNVLLKWQLKKKNWRGSSEETVKTPVFFSCPPSLLVSLAGLKWHLQDFVSQSIPIQAVDGHGSLFIVCHGDKAKTFAFVGVEISDNFYIDNSAKRPEHLPQDGLICILTQIVDENAPTAGRVPRHSTTATHMVYTHWRKPRTKEEYNQKCLASSLMSASH